MAKHAITFTSPDRPVQLKWLRYVLKLAAKEGFSDEATVRVVQSEPGHISLTRPRVEVSEVREGGA
jgi:hypothetical protein